MFGFLPLVGTAIGVGKSLFGGGGGKSRAPSPRNEEDDFFRQYQRFYGAGKNAVQGYSNLALSDFTKSVGKTLGDLNSIGALRSGAVPTAMGNLTEQYARTIGDYALQASSGAMENALGYRRDVQQYEDERRRSSRAGLFGTIGQLLGKGIGVAREFVDRGSTAGKVLKGIGG